MGSKSKQKKQNLPAKVEKAQVPVVPNATEGLLSGIGKLDFNGMLSLADTLVKSGFLPEAIKRKEQAVAIILKGAELRIPPMQALSSINIIKGKPTLAAQLMLAMAYQQIPGFTAERIELTNDKAVWKFQKPGCPSHTETFTADDAKGQDLLGKYNWKAMRKVMLNWRCISSGLRFYCPNVTMGLHTQEEINPDIKILNASTGEVEITEADYEVVPDIEKVPNGGRMSLKAPVKPEPEQDETDTMREALKEIEFKDYNIMCTELGITSQEEAVEKIEAMYELAIKKGIIDGEAGWEQAEPETVATEEGSVGSGEETAGAGEQEEATPTAEVEQVGGEVPII